MTDHQGSALPRFKAKLIEDLQAVAPNVVAYASPVSLSDALGRDGSGTSVFWLDETEASYELNVIHAGHLQFDETATPTLVIQCVGRTTDDTQQTVDERAAAMQWQVFKLLGTDPSLGLTANSDMQIVRGTPGAASIETGIDSQNMRGVRIELDIDLEARITAST